MRKFPNKDAVFPNPAIPSLCYIKNVVKNPRILVGDYTYYDDVDGADRFEEHVTHFYEFIGDRLIIGNFCAIAKGVNFIMNGANHRMDCATTYPFYIMGGDWGGMIAPVKDELPLKGDTVIGNDVWIGQNVTIMPGVHIGDGAIIGANSTVASNIPPYCVAVGNPARIVRKRFDDETIELLERLRWWDKPIDEIDALLPILTISDLEEMKTAIYKYLDENSRNFSIDTDRLILRRWRENDAEALFKYASDDRVSEMALWPRHTSVDMSREVIKNFFLPNPFTLAMVLKETGEPIGCIGIVPEGDEHFKPLTNEREVGYWIGCPYWGKGLTTEALSALTVFCRESLRLDSLLITTNAKNIASQRVAEKCGFVNFADYDNDETPSKAFRLKLHSLAIRKVEDDKREFMDLLLIGDESVDMIERYLEPGSLHVGSMDNKNVAVIVTVENDDGSVEIKNLAVDAAFRRRGIGRKMLEYVEKLYPDKRIILGTGETPSTLRFYRSCGYRYSHRIPNFFTDNYPNPIVEEEVTLRDMVYLYKDSNKNDAEEYS